MKSSSYLWVALGSKKPKHLNVINECKIDCGFLKLLKQFVLIIVLIIVLTILSLNDFKNIDKI